MTNIRLPMSLTAASRAPRTSSPAKPRPKRRLRSSSGAIANSALPTSLIAASTARPSTDGGSPRQPDPPTPAANIGERVGKAVRSNPSPDKLTVLSRKVKTARVADSSRPLAANSSAANCTRSSTSSGFFVMVRPRSLLARYHSGARQHLFSDRARLRRIGDRFARPAVPRSAPAGLAPAGAVRGLAVGRPSLRAPSAGRRAGRIGCARGVGGLFPQRPPLPATATPKTQRIFARLKNNQRGCFCAESRRNRAFARPFENENNQRVFKWPPFDRFPATPETCPLRSLTPSLRTDRFSDRFSDKGRAQWRRSATRECRRATRT